MDNRYFGFYYNDPASSDVQDKRRTAERFPKPKMNNPTRDRIQPRTITERYLSNTYDEPEPDDLQDKRRNAVRFPKPKVNVTAKQQIQPVTPSKTITWAELFKLKTTQVLLGLIFLQTVTIILLVLALIYRDELLLPPTPADQCMTIHYPKENESELYIGEVVDGFPHGVGFLKLKNGEIQFGHFKHGLKDGLKDGFGATESSEDKDNGR